MNINLIAADLASRVPDMAKDSAQNNEQLILQLLQQANVRIYMNPNCGTAQIDRERTRQIMAEGWSEKHDDQHNIGELISAAICYATAGDCLANSKDNETPELLKEEILLHKYGIGVAWPWGESWLKISTDPIRNLVKAGALIAAEIDRLQRLNQRNQEPKETT